MQNISHHFHQILTAVSLFVAIGWANPIVLAADPAGKLPEREESWAVIYLSGQRIGYIQSSVETVQQGNARIVKTSMLSNMTIKRFGQELKLNQSLTTEETPEGDLLQFRFELNNPPAAPTITSGKIEGTQLHLTKEVNRKAKTTVEPWTTSVKSPAYQDRYLKENPLKPGQTRSFDTFIPEFGKVGKTTLTGHDLENTRLLNNVSRKLFKVTSTQSLLPGVTTESYLDDAGETVKSSTSMLNTNMETFTVNREEALVAIVGGEIDLAINTLIKVKPILKGHESKRVVYRLSIPGQNPSETIPVGDTQSIKAIDKETVELTVTALPIPKTAEITSVPEEYLESSQFLQWKDERVRKHADLAAGDATDPAEIARRMEKYVHTKLENKTLSTALASASEVAQTLEGDCTEHAVLLAALLRAKGIPSRVAVGVVYVDKLFAFGGHMWTEANLSGKWVPLDATLGDGGIGAAHIKLAESSLPDKGPFAISSFAPLMTVIGRMKLEVLSSE